MHLQLLWDSPERLGGVWVLKRGRILLPVFSGSRIYGGPEKAKLGKYQTKAISIYNQKKEKKKSIVLLPDPDSLMQLFVGSSPVSVKDVSDILTNKINSLSMLTRLGSVASPLCWV